MPSRFDPPRQVTTERLTTGYIAILTATQNLSGCCLIGVGHPLGSRSERVASIGISLVHTDARSEGRLPTRANGPDAEPFDRTTDRHMEGLADAAEEKAPRRRPFPFRCRAAIRSRAQGAGWAVCPVAAWPARASRNACSFVWSKEVRSTVPPTPSRSASTLSVVILRISKNRPAPPGVSAPAASFMKSSLMPASLSAPPRAPDAAPNAAPTSGIKKITPISMPQNAPDGAPAAVRFIIWFSFTRPLSVLDGDHGIAEFDQVLLLQSHE